MGTSVKESADGCVIVIFGASGDLTKRKLIPALFELDQQKRLPDSMCVLGCSRTEMSDDEWRDHLLPMLEKQVPNFDRARWQQFARRLHYHAGSATDREMYPGLIKRINELGMKHGLVHRDGSGGPSNSMALPNVLFYLSVAPQLYEPIIERIGEAGMVFEGKRWCALDGAEVPWQRIIVEKPFGTDRESARRLNSTLGRVFEEEAVYRIDHYLGKELVQNILVMRFANTIFEPLWTSQYVDHVQVTAAESVGVGRRAGNYYDTAGATRDMVESHMLQVLSLIAMEPPNSYDATAIRREKIKVMSAVRAWQAHETAQNAVFGRYGRSGKPNDEDDGKAYVELDGVDPELATETYSAVRLHIDNWRWTGVPFFIRSGKKLARKLTEVVIQFKQPPACLFSAVEPFRSGGCRPANRIVINIAPDDGISLRFEAKVPGPKLVIDSVKADFDYKTVFNAEPVEAYGPLIFDAMRGDQTLFKHRDEVDNEWRICQPIIDSPEARRAIETYQPGSWGPAAADSLLAREGRHWHNPAKGETR